MPNTSQILYTYKLISTAVEHLTHEGSKHQDSLYITQVIQLTLEL